MAFNLKQQEIIAEATYGGFSDDKADPEDKRRLYRTTQANRFHHCPKTTTSSPPHLLTLHYHLSPCSLSPIPNTKHKIRPTTRLARVPRKTKDRLATER